MLRNYRKIIRQVKINSSNIRSYKPPHKSSIIRTYVTVTPNDNNIKQNVIIEPLTQNDKFTNSYFNAEKTMMDYIRISNIKIFRAILITILSFVAILFVFHKQVKYTLGKKSADVAVIALGDEGVRIKTNEFITTILTDPNTKKQIKLFITDLSNDDEVQKQLGYLISQSLKTSDVRENAKSLAIYLANDDYVNQEIKKLFLSVLSDEEIQKKVDKVFITASHAILNSNTVNENAKVFVKSILNDEKLLEETKEKFKSIIWKTITFR